MKPKLDTSTLFKIIKEKVFDTFSETQKLTAIGFIIGLAVFCHITGVLPVDFFVYLFSLLFEGM